MPTNTGINFASSAFLLKSWSGLTNSSDKKFTFAAWFEVPTGALGEKSVFTAVNAFGGTLQIGLTGQDGAGGGSVPEKRAYFIIQNDAGSAEYYYSPTDLVYGTKYFVMVVYDSAQATQANRLKVWFGPYNGAVAPISGWVDVLGSGLTIGLNETFQHGTGTGTDGDLLAYDLSLTNAGRNADVYWLDNVALADPSALLNNYSTAAAPGTYSGSYGNTGYHLDFANSGSLGDDVSGNGNDWSLSGTPTQITGYFSSADETADLAATEDADTASFTATVSRTATLDATEAQDTASFTVTVGNTEIASLAATEAPDTAAFSATVSRTATLAATEDADTAAFVVTVGNTELASLAATEAADTAAFSATVAKTATLDATEAPDTASFALTNQPVTQPLITGGGRWREHRPNYRIHPEYDDPKPVKRKPAPVETGVVLAPNPIPELRLGDISPANNVFGELQRMRNEVLQAEADRLQRLKAIARADDDWLLHVA